MCLSLTITILLILLNIQCQTAHSQGCTRGFADILQFGDNGRNGRQYIFPGITFTCHGNITRWIFYGNWVDNNGGFPEFQIWRNNGLQNYIKVGSTAVSYDERPDQNSNRYEYSLSELEELPFQPGDILGVHAPKAGKSRLRQRYEQGGVVEMSFFRSALNPMDTFQIQTSGTDDIVRSVTTDLPMITVEVEVSATNIPHDQPSSVVPLQSNVVPMIVPTSSSLLSSCKGISAITVSLPSPDLCRGTASPGEQQGGGIRDIAIYGGLAGGAILAVVIGVLALTAVVLVMRKNHKRTPITHSTTKDSKVVTSVKPNGSDCPEEVHNSNYYDTPIVKNPSYNALSQLQMKLPDPEYDQIGDYRCEKVNSYANVTDLDYVYAVI